jgi:hypothetical protein
VGEGGSCQEKGGMVLEEAQAVGTSGEVDVGVVGKVKGVGGKVGVGHHRWGHHSLP